MSNWHIQSRLRRRTLAAAKVCKLVHSYSGAALRLEGTTIVGDIDLSRAVMEFDLELVNCLIKGGLLLTGASGRSIDLAETRVGSISASRLHLTGDLSLRQACVGHASGIPQHLPGQGEIDGDQVVVAQRVRDESVSAVLRLSGARIDGALLLEDARLVSDQQWTLFAARARFGGSLLAARLSSTGALYLRHAQVGGQVLFDGATVGGVDATATDIASGFYADWGFTTTGQVRLRGARVGHIVTFHDAVLASPEGSLNLARLGTSRLRLDFRSSPSGRVSLRDAQIDSLVDVEHAWPATGKLDVEGLVYRRIASTSTIDVGKRLDWLTRDRHASAGSFEQLALSFERSGDERGARSVRRQRERHLRKRDTLPARIWGVMQDALFGYGYMPHRALTWLIALVIAGSTWFARNPPLPVRKDGHPSWDPVLYTLDLIVPIANLGHRTAWNPVGLDKAVAVVLVLAGWLLATAIISGLGRLLSRT
jgi:hypothetical protein